MFFVFIPSIKISKEICIEENSQAEGSTQSAQATDGRSGSLAGKVREQKRSRKIASDLLFLLLLMDIFCFDC